MKANKSVGTKPEIDLAKALFARGYRYRKNDKSVLGKPDLTFKSIKLAVFVDGEFWHGKEWEIQKYKIKSNQEYWLPKIECNLKRDKEVNDILETKGWTVLRFWSKDIKKNLLSCILQVERLINSLKNNNKTSSNNINSQGSDLVKKKFIPQHSNDATSLKVAEEALQYEMLNTYNIPFTPIENPKFQFIDLFAGIGGFRLAFQNLGGKCIYSSEWDKYSQKTYRANFGEVPFGDITNELVKSYIPTDFDILCAGFPCQAFSIAGFRKGFFDTRGTLFFEIEKIIEKHSPKVVFLENVKNLISHDNGKTFSVIIETLEKNLKYKVFYKILNSMTHANLPQNRERIFIVAFNSERVKNYYNFKFPEEIKLTKTIHDILDKKRQNIKYYYLKNHIYYSKLRQAVVNKDTVYQWRRIYVRENKNNVCPTLTANMGTGGHNVPIIKDDFGIRKLTPKECFAFQGYPTDTFVLPPSLPDSKLYMQAGNSVTTTLIEKIGKEIIKIL